MIRKTLIATAVLTVASGAVYAQPAGPQLSAPELGFIYDASAQNIRKISGVPGAASLDGAVALDVTFTSAWVHSASQTAVGIAKSGEITGAGWSGEAPVAAALESNLDGLTLASFSRSGGFVVLSDGESVELWTGIGGEAALADAFSPAGGVLAVAVNNAGTVAVATGAGQIVVSAGDSSVVAASGSGGRRGGPRGTVAASGAGFSALAFLPGGKDLVAADSGQLVRIHDAATGPSRLVLADVGGTVRALAVSLDGETLAAAVGQGIAVTSAIAAGPVSQADCGCEAIGLSSLKGNLVAYLVTAGGESPAIVDASGTAPRITTLTRQLSALDVDGGIAQ